MIVFSYPRSIVIMRDYCIVRHVGPTSGGQINKVSGYILWVCVPDGLVVRIRRSHRRGRGSIPRLGESFPLFSKFQSESFNLTWDTVFPNKKIFPISLLSHQALRLKLKLKLTPRREVESRILTTWPSGTARPFHVLLENKIHNITW